MSRRLATKSRLMLLALWFFVGSALASPVISISPLISTRTVGSSFGIGVDLIGANDVYAYQFDIQFDPDLLVATSATEGLFLKTAGSTVFIPGFIDNDSGLVSFNSGTLVGAVVGASGGGNLAEIGFSATASGVSALALSNVLLLDSSLNTITGVEVVSGQVRLDTSSHSVPEPTSALLVALCLLSMRVCGRRRQ